MIGHSRHSRDWSSTSQVCSDRNRDRGHCCHLFVVSVRELAGGAVVHARAIARDVPSKRGAPGGRERCRRPSLATLQSPCVGDTSM
jgi:hypothetical protein